MEEKQRENNHRLQIRERSQGSVTGVRDVVAFDEGEISLITSSGMLTVKGKELHVTRLDLEKQEVDIAGQVDSLIYSQGKGKEKEGMIKRLFR
ncbi:MAG: sporulation protein YabP [Blautia sp.]